MKKSLIALALLPLMAGCSGTTGQKSETVHNVFLTEAEPAGAAGRITLPATVEESRTIAVGFKTAGQIDRILVREGDRVQQGQLLAVLDTVDYALGVSQLREQYAMQAAEQVRRRQLHAAGNMSDNDFEKAESGLRQMALQLELQENKLDYCRLTAPASGVITKRSFEPAEMVDAGTPVFELMDAGRLEVNVDLPVRHYAQRAGFTAFEGSTPLQPGRTFGLQMLSLTPRADNNQLYRLKLGVAPGSDVQLTPGVNVTVSILTSGSGEQGVNVPLSALFERDGRRYVWAFNPADSVISAVEVTPQGVPADGRLTVSGALTPGSSIVRAGVHHLTEGEKVRPITPESSL